MMRLNKELGRLYKNVSLRHKLHIALRYLLCPFSEVEKFIPKEGKILDLGCGHGILANILAIKADSRYVVGIDKDAGRIVVASSTLFERNNIEFRISDIQDYVLDSDVKCAVLADVPLETSRGLLAKIYAALSPEGVLIIKSISRSPSWKYYLTLFHMLTLDRLLRVSLRKNVYFLKEEDFTRLLQEIGFRVKFLNIDQGYFYSHCLYVCNKD